MHPIIYVSACNCSHLSTAITLSAFIACYNGQNLYTGNPLDPAAATDRWGSTACEANTWTFWQVSSTGAISGVSGNVTWMPTTAPSLSWFPGRVSNRLYLSYCSPRERTLARVFL